MATNDTVQPKIGRQLSLQVMHTLRKKIRFDDASLSGIVGVLPKGAIIHTGTLFTTTAFNTGTLNVGKQGGDADEYASAIVMTSAATAFDDLVIGNMLMTEETVMTYARSATQSSGEGYIVVTYSVDNG